MQHIRLMSNFNAWANKLIYAVCSQLSDQEYRIDRKAFLGSIRHTLNHLILVDRIWICRFLGYEDSEIHSLDQILFDDFEELQQARIDKDQRLIDLIDSIDQSQLDQILQYKPMCGENTNYARANPSYRIQSSDSSSRSSPRDAYAMRSKSSWHGSDRLPGGTDIRLICRGLCRCKNIALR